MYYSDIVNTYCRTTNLLILPPDSAIAVRECKRHQQKPLSLREYFQRQQSRMMWPSQGLLKDFSHTTLAKILRLAHPTRCSEMRGQMQEFICLGGMEEWCTARTAACGVTCCHLVPFFKLHIQICEEFFNAKIHVNLAFRTDRDFSLYMMMLAYFLLWFCIDLQEAYKL